MKFYKNIIPGENIAPLYVISW